jgi:hypothetical protein
MRFFVAGIATLMKKQFMQPKANRANQRHTFARRRIDPRGRHGAQDRGAGGLGAADGDHHVRLSARRSDLRVDDDPVPACGILLRTYLIVLDDHHVVLVVRNSSQTSLQTKGISALAVPARESLRRSGWRKERS